MKNIYIIFAKRTGMDYKKLLIRQETFDGSSYTPVSPATIVDTQVRWNIVCKDFPFMYLPESKDLAVRDWYDEDGEDVFVPSSGKRFKAYDLEAVFLYVGTEQDMHAQLKSFIDFLYGRNSGGSPVLAVFDEYTHLGFHGIHATSVGNDLFDISDVDSDAISMFKVKFRVTAPTSIWNGQS